MDTMTLWGKGGGRREGGKRGEERKGRGGGRGGEGERRRGGQEEGEGMGGIEG